MKCRRDLMLQPQTCHSNPFFVTVRQCAWMEAVVGLGREDLGLAAEEGLVLEGGQNSKSHSSVVLFSIVHLKTEKGLRLYRKSMQILL